MARKAAPVMDFTYSASLPRAVKTGCGEVRTTRGNTHSPRIDKTVPENPC